VEARRRPLARDVQVAYFRFRKAQARVDILEATRTRVREHLRTSRRLLASAKVTKDAVHRAEVEVLDVRQRLADAQSARDHARRRLNVLCNRQTTAPIPAPTTDVDRLIAQRRRAVEQALGRAFSDSDAVAVAPGAVGAPERAVVAGTEATGGGRGGPEGAEWISRRATERPRLARLDAAADAADDRRRAAQTEYLPTVSLGVEAGIQGERYGFSGDKPFGRASLTLEWNLFDGFRDRSRVQRRELEAKRLRTRRAHVEQQLALEAHKALEAVRVAQQSLHTAAARVTAARESFRLTRRRYDAERASQAALIDARTALTRAELNRTVTRYDLLIHLARLAHAAGLSVPGRR
jgi:outer membrane protein TolC